MSKRDDWVAEQRKFWDELTRTVVECTRKMAEAGTLNCTRCRMRMDRIKGAPSLCTWCIEREEVVGG